MPTHMSKNTYILEYHKHTGIPQKREKKKEKQHNRRKYSKHSIPPLLDFLLFLHYFLSFRVGVQCLMYEGSTFNSYSDMASFFSNI